MPDYRSLPSVHELAGIPELQSYKETIRIRASREAIDYVRKAMANGHNLDVKEIAIRSADQMEKYSLVAVHNMSGVILHTGLGRAPHSEIYEPEYVNLEFDLETGKRGDRQDHVVPLLRSLTGAEDALVVNNGAAGVLLALTALCSRKEVLLSRGQSVEIGGAFRMPDVIRASGCKLVDVGTTNKTYVQDYVEAISPKSAAILRCHPSNYAISGFTEEPKLEDLARLAHESGLILIDDQGNGAMKNLDRFGVYGVSTMPDSIRAGADVVIGSGDKLLGGPQCGIILGRKDLITKMKKHPLARALRINKSSLVQLQSVLRQHHFDDTTWVPLYKALSFTQDDIKMMCEAIAPEGADIVESVTELGSGTTPGQGVPSYSIVLRTAKPDRLLGELRRKRIIGRIHKGAVWLDPRSGFFSLVAFGENGFKIRVQFAQGLRKVINSCWEQWK